MTWGVQPPTAPQSYQHRMAFDLKNTDPYTRTMIMSMLAGIKAHNSQMLVGNPGLGKSAVVGMLARKVLRYDMITIIGSQKEPQDVTGFPRQSSFNLPDGKQVPVTEYSMQLWQFQILRKKKIVLFLDEFSNSTPAVQASMLTILNEREFPDGSKVPDETVIIGAMNPVETAADGYELGLPVTNRLKFIPWEPDFETWSAGLLSNWGDPSGKTPEVMYWRKVVVAFLRKNPDLLYKLPTKDMYEQTITDARGSGKADPAAVYGFEGSPAQADIYKMAYPSNRSWTNFAEELGYCGNNSSLMRLAGNGIVGYEACSKFMSFVRGIGNKRPSIEAAMANPAKINWGVLDANDVMTLFTQAVQWAESKGRDKNAANALAAFMLSGAAAGKESYGSAVMDRALSIIRHADNGAQLSKEIRLKYSAVGQLLGGY